MTDYPEVVFDEACNETFHQNLEYTQYNTCLALSGGFRGTSKEKLH